MDKPCTISNMETRNDSEPAVVDFRSHRHIAFAARKVQRGLAAALPPNLQGVPRWKLVQEKHLPSLRAIADGLFLGRYKELL